MSPRARSGVLAFLVVAAAGASAGCGNLRQGREQAAQAVTAFHEQFNAGRHESIYDASDDQLKRTSSRESFAALLGAVRRKLGDVTGTTATSWNVRTSNLTTWVTLAQDTTYASGRATETFRFVIRDGRAVLVSWNVSSNDLILR